ncbi:MAG TPA: cytochrome C oxidase subunit IV family protein [Saprospiraceae bacterium]|nr:cytochrome C oxidase subunit IV family protein [Saprospiraceae bacterium]
MAGHLSYEASKKVVFKGLILLGIVTLVEVFIALLGKGYIVHGFHLPKLIMYSAMIILSLYKAYFIIYEFMHMRYEVPGLVRSVLFPTALLIWAAIAFFQEGNTWRKYKAKVHDREVILPKTEADHTPSHAPEVKESGHPEMKAEPEGKPVEGVHQH